MREILFRGKRVDNGEWVYGYPYENYRNSCLRKLIALPPNEFGRGEYIEVIPETIGQYTGLTDKNGEKIFEGDIFTYKEEYAKIEYDDDSAMFIIQFDDWYMDFDFLHGHEVEILGNIHDNPELLEV